MSNDRARRKREQRRQQRKRRLAMTQPFSQFLAENHKTRSDSLTTQEMLEREIEIDNAAPPEEKGFMRGMALASLAAAARGKELIMPDEDPDGGWSIRITPAVFNWLIPQLTDEQHAYVESLAPKFADQGIEWTDDISCALDAVFRIKDYFEYNDLEPPASICSEFLSAILDLSPTRADNVLEALVRIGMFSREPVA